MKTFKVTVNGMSCGNCAARLQKAFSDKQGIEASVNFATKTLAGEYDESLWDEEKIAGLVHATGYEAGFPKAKAQGPSCGCGHEDEGHEHAADSTKGAKRSLWLGCILSLILMVPTFEHLKLFSVPAIFMQPWFQWLLSTIVLIFTGRGFFVGAVKGIRHMNLNMHVLVAIGAGTAYCYSLYQWFYYDLYKGLGNEQHYYFETAAVIVTLIFVGHYLEKKATARTTTALQDLADLRPPQARVIRDGTEIRIPSGEIVLHDTIIVGKGERVPVDGIVASGSSYVNESMITGESMPVLKTKGSDVIGGTQNEGDSFTFTANKVGEDTMLAGIIRVVEEAQNKRPNIQRIADRISNIFVPTILIIAAVTFIAWMMVSGDFIRAFDAAMSVIVISCPCALGLATPLSILVGTSNAAKSGILYKAGDVFERIQKIDAICFDKTGTLTEGKPTVLAYHGDSSVFSEILSLEKPIMHPLAYALKQYALENQAQEVFVSDFRESAGFGVEGRINGSFFRIGSLEYMKQNNIKALSRFDNIIEVAMENGQTLVFIAREDTAISLACISDQIKENAKTVIAKLKTRGIETFMITGDNEKAAHAVAGSIGIDHVYANVLPVKKAEYVKKIQEQGKQVAFVGDGINDAPALVTSDLGIALGSGSTISISSADVILVNSDLESVDRALQLSSATLRNIYQNFAWAFSYNIIAIPVAAFGLLNPMLAASFMAFSDIVVVLNAYRLHFFKSK